MEQFISDFANNSRKYLTIDEEAYQIMKAVLDFEELKKQMLEYKSTAKQREEVAEAADALDASSHTVNKLKSLIQVDQENDLKNWRLMLTIDKPTVKSKVY